MNSEITNGTLTVIVKKEGAELISLKDNDGTEFMWQGDKSIWPRHSPVLFPIVGRLKNDIYSIDDNIFSMPQHGFARDKDFELKRHSTNEIVFSLKADVETLKKFPFNFELLISYSLNAKSLAVKYTVINLSEIKMPFSIGAHPGFCCPVSKNETFDDYEIRFSENEKLETALLQNGLFNGKKKMLDFNSNLIQLNNETFINDALVFENLRSQFVTLQSKKSSHYVKVSLIGFPYLGIWSKPGALFVCLEPWYGKADSIDANGNIFKKEGMIILNPSEAFNCSYSIEVG